ncbi:MAG: flippase-like domain-containing protein [Candidatus Hadarchaeota archaeon]
MPEKEIRVNLKRLIVSVIVGAVLIVLALLLISKENLTDMMNAILKANYALVLSAVGIFFFGLALWSSRWKMILASAGHKTKFSRLYPIQLSGVFINNVTPFTYSGGDPIARSYLLKKTHSVPYSAGFATMIGEFVMDFPIFFSFLILGLVLGFGTLSASTLLVLLVVWACVLFFFMSMVPRAFCRLNHPKIAHLIYRALKAIKRPRREAEICRTLNRFVNPLRMIVDNRFALPVAFISIMIWMTIMMRYLLIFEALGIHPSIPMLLMTLTLPAIVGLVPVLPAGLGTVDFTYYSIFTLFNVPQSLALSAILVERMITFVLGIIVGAIALSYLGVKIWKK